MHTREALQVALGTIPDKWNVISDDILGSGLLNKMAKRVTTSNACVPVMESAKTLCEESENNKNWAHWETDLRAWERAIRRADKYIATKGNHYEEAGQNEQQIGRLRNVDVNDRVAKYKSAKGTKTAKHDASSETHKNDLIQARWRKLIAEIGKAETHYNAVKQKANLEAWKRTLDRAKEFVIVNQLDENNRAPFKARYQAAKYAYDQEHPGVLRRMSLWCTNCMNSSMDEPEPPPPPYQQLKNP